MEWTTVLVLSVVALAAFSHSSSVTPEGCGELGCEYNGIMDKANQDQYRLLDRDLCIFRGIPINCNMFLRMPCYFYNMGPSSWGAPVSQGGRGSRAKRQVAGATAIASTRGFAYPFGIFGGYPFMSGYGSNWNNQ